jgi:hypothetical protein
MIRDQGTKVTTSMSNQIHEAFGGISSPGARERGILKERQVEL